MSACRLPIAIYVSFLVTALSFAQTKTPAATRGSARPQLDSLVEPPVPSDPLELVTGETQVVQTPEERAQILKLLGDAHARSYVRAYPYDLKTTFVSTGSSLRDGPWELEDVSPNGETYRWIARGNDYSVVNLYSKRVLYSNQPAGTVPLRLEQVRTAIFFAYLAPRFLQSSLIRTAFANLNGTELTCALFSGGSNSPTATPGRRWEETEYCVDAKSGFLVTYSAAPGVYVLYDYSNALHFHGIVLPGKITVTEAGNTVIEAHLESVTDPAKSDPDSFTPSSSMTAIGVGSLMSLPMRFPIFVANSTVRPNTVQPVIVHGVLTPEGEIAEPEALQTTNSILARAALDAVKNWHAGDRTAPGATPQQREVYINVKFINSGS